MFFKENRSNRFDLHFNSQIEKSDEPTVQPDGDEIEPTYETEVRHESIDQFKKELGFYEDLYKQRYRTTNYSDFYYNNVSSTPIIQ